MTGVVVDVSTKTGSTNQQLAEINNKLAQLVKNTSLANQGLGSLGGGGAFGKLDKQLVNTTKNFTKFGDSSSESLRGVAKEGANTSRTFGAMQGIVVKLGVAFAALGSAMAFVKISDNLTNIRNRLALVADGIDAINARQQILYNLSKKTGESLSETSKIYTSMSSALSGKFEDKKILQVVETIQKANAMSGGSKESIAAAMFQLQQGLSGGVIRGEELNSMMEQMRYVTKGVAKELGVTVGQLRNLEGGLTPERFVDAILKMKDATEKDFNKVVVTFERAFGRINAAFDNFLNSFSQSQDGFAARTVKWIMGLADTLDDFTEFFHQASLSIGLAIENYFNQFRTMGTIKQTVRAILRFDVRIDNFYNKARSTEIVRRLVEYYDKLFKSQNAIKITPLVEILGQESEIAGFFKRIRIDTELFRETMEVAFETILVSIINFTRLLPRFKGLVLSFYDKIGISLVDMFKRRSAEAYKTLMPFARMFEAFSEKMSLFTHSDNELARSWTRVFQASSLKELLSRVRELNQARQELYWGNKSLLGEEFDRQVTLATLGIRRLLVSLRLMDQDLFLFKDFKVDRIKMELMALGTVIQRIYQDVIKQTFGPTVHHVMHVAVAYFREYTRIVQRMLDPNSGKKMANLFFDGISSVLKGSFNLWQSQNEVAEDWFQPDSLLKQFKKGLNGLIESLATFVGTFVAQLVDRLVEVVPSKVFDRLYDAFKKKAAGSGKELLKMVVSPFMTINSHLENLKVKIRISPGTLDDAKIALVEMFQRIIASARKLLGFAANLIIEFGKLIKRVFYDIYDAVVGHSYWPDTIDGIIKDADRLKLAENRVDKFSKIISDIFSGIRDYFSDLGIDPEDLFGNLKKAIANFDLSAILRRSLSDVIANAGALGIAFIEGFYSKLFAGAYFLSYITKMTDAHVRELSLVIGKVLGDIFANLLTHFSVGMVKILDIVAQAVPKVISGFVEEFAPALHAIIGFFMKVTAVGELLQNTLVQIAIAFGAIALWGSDKKLETLANWFLGSKPKGKNAANMPRQNGILPMLADVTFGPEFRKNQKPLAPHPKFLMASVAVMATTVLDSVSALEASVFAVPLLLAAFVGQDGGIRLLSQIMSVVRQVIFGTVGYFGKLGTEVFGKDSLIGNLYTGGGKKGKGKRKSPFMEFVSTFAEYPANLVKNATAYSSGQMGLMDALTAKSINRRTGAINNRTSIGASWNRMTRRVQNPRAKDTAKSVSAGFARVRFEAQELLNLFSAENMAVFVKRAAKVIRDIMGIAFVGLTGMLGAFFKNLNKINPKMMFGGLLLAVSGAAMASEGLLSVMGSLTDGFMALFAAASFTATALITFDAIGRLFKGYVRGSFEGAFDVIPELFKEQMSEILHLSYNFGRRLFGKEWADAQVKNLKKFVGEWSMRMGPLDKRNATYGSMMANFYEGRAAFTRRKAIPKEQKTYEGAHEWIKRPWQSMQEFARSLPRLATDIGSVLRTLGQASSEILSQYGRQLWRSTAKIREFFDNLAYAVVGGFFDAWKLAKPSFQNLFNSLKPMFMSFMKWTAALGAGGVMFSVFFGKGDTFFDKLQYTFEMATEFLGFTKKTTTGGRKAEIASLVNGVPYGPMSKSLNLSKVDWGDVNKVRYENMLSSAQELNQFLKDMDKQFANQGGMFTNAQLRSVEEQYAKFQSLLNQLPQTAYATDDLVTALHDVAEAELGYVKSMNVAQRQAGYQVAEVKDINAFPMVNKADWTLGRVFSKIWDFVGTVVELTLRAGAAAAAIVALNSALVLTEMTAVKLRSTRVGKAVVQRTAEGPGIMATMTRAMGGFVGFLFKAFKVLAIGYLVADVIFETFKDSFNRAFNTKADTLFEFGSQIFDKIVEGVKGRRDKNKEAFKEDPKASSFVNTMVRFANVRENMTDADKAFVKEESDSITAIRNLITEIGNSRGMVDKFSLQGIAEPKAMFKDTQMQREMFGVPVVYLKTQQERLSAMKSLEAEAQKREARVALMEAAIMQRANNTETNKAVEKNVKEAIESAKKMGATISDELAYSLTQAQRDTIITSQKAADLYKKQSKAYERSPEEFSRYKQLEAENNTFGKTFVESLESYSDVENLVKAIQEVPTLNVMLRPEELKNNLEDISNLELSWMKSNMAQRAGLQAQLAKTTDQEEKARLKAQIEDIDRIMKSRFDFSLNFESLQESLKKANLEEMSIKLFFTLGDDYKQQLMDARKELEEADEEYNKAKDKSDKAAQKAAAKRLEDAKRQMARARAEAVASPIGEGLNSVQMLEAFESRGIAQPALEIQASAKALNAYFEQGLKILELKRQIGLVDQMLLAGGLDYVDLEKWRGVLIERLASGNKSLEDLGKAPDIFGLDSVIGKFEGLTHKSFAGLSGTLQDELISVAKQLDEIEKKRNKASVMPGFKGSQLEADIKKQENMLKASQKRITQEMKGQTGFVLGMAGVDSKQAAQLGARGLKEISDDQVKLNDLNKELAELQLDIVKNESIINKKLEDRYALEQKIAKKKESESNKDMMTRILEFGGISLDTAMDLPKATIESFVNLWKEGAEALKTAQEGGDYFDVLKNMKAQREAVKKANLETLKNNDLFEEQMKNATYGDMFGKVNDALSNMGDVGKLSGEQIRTFGREISVAARNVELAKQGVGDYSEALKAQEAVLHKVILAANANNANADLMVAGMKVGVDLSPATANMIGGVEAGILSGMFAAMEKAKTRLETETKPHIRKELQEQFDLLGIISADAIQVASRNWSVYHYEAGKRLADNTVGQFTGALNQFIDTNARDVLKQLGENFARGISNSFLEGFMEQLTGKGSFLDRMMTGFGAWMSKGGKKNFDWIAEKMQPFTERVGGFFDKMIQGVYGAFNDGDWKETTMGKFVTGGFDTGSEQQDKFKDEILRVKAGEDIHKTPLMTEEVTILQSIDITLKHILQAFGFGPQGGGFNGIGFGKEPGVGLGGSGGLAGYDPFGVNEKGEKPDISEVAGQIGQDLVTEVGKKWRGLDFSSLEAFGTSVLNILSDTLMGQAMSGLTKMMKDIDWGGMIQGAMSLFGFGAATGGRIIGPGTGTSDSIPAFLSRGEFVVRESVARSMYPLLHAINAGHIPAFANGGMVGQAVPVPQNAYGDGRGTTINFQITGDVSRQTRKEIMMMSPQIAGMVQNDFRERRIM